MRRWSALLARPDTAMTGWCAVPFQIAQRAEELEAVHARHPEIADDQIDALAHQRLERLDSVLRRQDIGAKPFEHQASRLARVFDVLDHEYPEAIQPLQAARPRAHRRWPLFCLRFNERKPNCHFCAKAGSLAGNRRSAHVRLHQLFDQGEADAQSRMCASIAFFLLLEHLEDERQEFRGDALSRIAHANHAAHRLLS